MRTSVVLPAPLGPSTATTAPAATCEVDVRKGDHGSEALGDSSGRHDRSAAQPLRRGATRHARAAPASMGAPHCAQKRSLARAAAPQAVQNRAAAAAS